jgi:hypothetical protein
MRVFSSKAEIASSAQGQMPKLHSNPLVGNFEVDDC